MPDQKPSYVNFNKHSYHWSPDIDYKANPSLYKVGKGEQGVLICEPYKSEILPYWRFKDESVARESSEKIYNLFLAYLEGNDFVGADMARKFLQMGFTRARRYANYKGGKKYDKSNDYRLNEKGTGDPEKARAATIFYKKWKLAERHMVYKREKEHWKKRYG